MIHHHWITIFDHLPHQKWPVSQVLSIFRHTQIISSWLWTEHSMNSGHLIITTHVSKCFISTPSLSGQPHGSESVGRGAAGITWPAINIGKRWIGSRNISIHHMKSHDLYISLLDPAIYCHSLPCIVHVYVCGYIYIIIYIYNYIYI